MDFLIHPLSSSSSHTEREREREREMAWRRYCCGEVVPFLAMVVVEGVYVGLNTLFKAASGKGLSDYVFIVYSFATATLFLLPLAFFSHRSLSHTRFSLDTFEKLHAITEWMFLSNFCRAGLPPFKVSVFLKICLLGLITYVRVVEFTGQSIL